MAYTQNIKLTSPSAGIAQYYGNAVSIYGYYAAVAEVGNNTVYIYKRSVDVVWELNATLTVGVPSTFGSSVAFGKDYLVVGDSGANKAYVYTVGQWDVVSTELTGIGAFGCSVAVSGDYIIVGAKEADSNMGDAYIWEKSSSGVWVEYSLNPITAEIRTVDNYFGVSVAVSDSYVMVGAHGDDNKKGAVYVFERDDDTEVWSQSYKLLASDGVDNDEFGGSISISGNYLVSASKLRESDSDELNAGAVYLFKHVTTWYEIDKIVSSQESNYESNHFGESVCIQGDYVIVGSPEARFGGVVDTFSKKRSWGYLKKIIGSDTATDDDFGSSVSIYNPFLIVGAPGDSLGAGSVYIFEDPSVRLRLAQEFSVDASYIPSKATLYLKRSGSNFANYWSLDGEVDTVVDATNFYTITEYSNRVTLSDTVSGFTGNGYMYMDDDTYSSYDVINYPIAANEAETFNIWLRCLSTESNTFNAEILIDGNISKTISESMPNPSVLEWTWISVSLSIPDIRSHTLGIKLKEKGLAIDKLYITASDTTPYADGSEYGISPYLTVHLQVYESDGIPTDPLFIYDYKNSVDEITQSDWYNFDINVLNSSQGYITAEEFAGDYFLVLSCSGSNTDNFITWEMVDNDEYMSLPSAIRI